MQSRNSFKFASVIEGGVKSIKYVIGNCHSLDYFTTAGVFPIVAMFSLIHSLFQSLLILTKVFFVEFIPVLVRMTSLRKEAYGFHFSL